MFIQIEKLHEAVQAKIKFCKENCDVLKKKIENRYIFNLRKKAYKSWFYRNFTMWKDNIEHASCMCSYWKDEEYIKNDKDWTIAISLMWEIPFNVLKESPHSIVRITREEELVLFGKK